MIADIGGFLAGAVVDKETPIFRGAGNLSVLSQDGCYFFLGISIVGGTVLTFGDQTSDDLVFVAANYEPKAENSLSQLIFLKKGVFEPWFLQDGNPPPSEEWFLISFGDFIATNDSTKRSDQKNSFENSQKFQVGLSIFIKYCTNLKKNKDPLYNSLLLISVNDEVDANNLSGGLNETENEEDDDIEATAVGGVEHQVGKRKPSKKKDPNAVGVRSSDRNFVKRLNQMDAKELEAPSNSGFQMPRRGGRKSASGGDGSKKKDEKTKPKNDPKTNKKDNPAPPKIDKRLRLGADDTDNCELSAPKKITPAAYTTPIPAAALYTFDVAMTQQDRILDYQERFSNFIFGAAERYKNGR